MSDVSQGPGWWQASDGKWHRPESFRGASGHGRPGVPRRNRPGGLPVAVGATLALVLLVIVVVAVRRTSGRERRAVATVSSTASHGATTAPAATTTTTPQVVYRVKSGDTLTRIADHFRVPISVIIARNHIANPNRLSLGQTLVIPPAPPLKLAINPHEGEAGDAFQLELTGAVPSETIRFEIDFGSRTFTGGPHTVSADGAVTATYQTDLAGPAGTYSVTATGNRGTLLHARFILDPARP